MSCADRTLAFAGTDEELERYLQEFARLTDGWAARDRKRGGWAVGGGALLSSNPNTAPRAVRIVRGGEGLTLSAPIRGLPWTKPKRSRLAGHRMGQLADYLTARVRGSGPEKFATLPMREPYAPLGSGVAALTASYSWLVLTGITAFAAGAVAATLAFLPLMALSIRDIASHSQALLAAGTIPLPTPAEAASTGPLGPAIVFALPVAFFAALIHSLALFGSELGPRGARLPQASFVFLWILTAIALFPFLSFSGLVLALAIPAGVHLGSTLVWARRRERLREGPRPPKAAIVIAVALAASLAGAVAPRGADWKDALLHVARFRDAWLLDNALGRSIAAGYYRYTLYTAEPIKELYSIDDRRARRAQVLAECGDPSTIPLLRALGFVVVPPGRDHEIEVSDVVAYNFVSIRRNGGSLQDLRVALDELSRATFRGARLRELSSLGWHAVYYAGPPIVLVVAMGAFAPFVSLLFRRVPPKMAVFALSGCAIVASLSLVLIAGQPPPKADDAELAEALAHADPAVRVEAAFRAAQMESTKPLADALLRAADDADLRVRLWAVAALGKSGDPRAYDKLVARLDDPEIFVRYRAAEGLGHLHDPRAAEPLLRVMNIRSWYEGAYALDALRRIKPGTP